ncbi:MAG: mechanosensitive ion channel [Gemmatimonadetes bacterium]|nr:mechanosensitive ion channel [Gemmatimonadota bacterium]
MIATVLPSRLVAGLTAALLASASLVGCAPEEAPDSPVAQESQDTAGPNPTATVDSASAQPEPTDSAEAAPATATPSGPGQDVPSEPALAVDGQQTPQDSLIALVLGLSARLDSLVTAEAQGAAPDSAASTLSLPDAPEFRFVGMRIFWTLVVLATTALLVRSLAFVLEALAERNAERRLFYKRLVPLARLFSWIVAVVVVARIVWSVDAQGLLAAGAAGAVAIGFASQDILKNVFGGLVIVADRPFAAGDKVRVGNTYGEVVSVGLWSTRITTPDDNLVSVPNSQVVNGQVANANSGALDCQVVTDLYLPGWVDERLAKKIAYEAAASSPFVYLHKPIVVLVRDVFDQTFLTNLKVKAYVLDQRYEFRFMSDVTERARDEFRKHGLLDRHHGALPVYRVDQRSEQGQAVPDAETGDS